MQSSKGAPVFEDLAPAVEMFTGFIDARTREEYCRSQIAETFMKGDGRSHFVRLQLWCGDSLLPDEMRVEEINQVRQGVVLEVVVVPIESSRETSIKDEEDEEDMYG
jgi:hypothetical protein